MIEAILTVTAKETHNLTVTAKVTPKLTVTAKVTAILTVTGQLIVILIVIVTEKITVILHCNRKNNSHFNNNKKA